MSKGSKLLLGLVTIIPTVYMVLFLITVFSLMPANSREWEERQNDELTAAVVIDVDEVEQMIANGEVSELRVTRDQIFAIDANGGARVARTLDEDAIDRIVLQARNANSRGSRIQIVSGNTSTDSATDDVIDRFPRLLPVHGIAIALMLGLMGYYLSRVLINPNLGQTARIIWVVLICVLSVWVMPFYWLLYVWRDSDSRDHVPGLSVHARI